MISKALKERPLFLILLVAAVLRITTAIFSEGYLMHDDHFWVVEAAASWSEGEDYNNWLPWSQEKLGLDPKPHYANIFYASLHYYYFEITDWLSLTPFSKMGLLRILQGLFSLLAVMLSFKITKNLAGTKPAVLVGFMVACTAWIPLLSVHQMVEMSAIVPLLAFTWVLTKESYSDLKNKDLIIAGVYLGIATGLRYQVGVMGLGLVASFILLEKGLTKSAITNSLIAGTSALIAFSATQLPTDFYLWGEPFAQLKAYIEYNLNNHNEYPGGTPLTYLFTILVLAAPPLSLLFTYGYLKSIKKHALVVIPSLAFIVFHSVFPNRQERFILPALPYIFIVGSIVYYELFHKNILGKAILYISFSLNFVILIPLTFFSKNTGQMQAMEYIRQQGDLESFLYVLSDGEAHPPRFYSDAWCRYTVANQSTDVAAQRITHCKDENTIVPNYLIFVGGAHIGELTNRFKDHYHSMEYETRIKPGLFDIALNYFNPRIPLKEVMIYKIDPTLECSEIE